MVCFTCIKKNVYIYLQTFPLNVFKELADIRSLYLTLKIARASAKIIYVQIIQCAHVWSLRVRNRKATER